MRPTQIRLGTPLARAVPPSGLPPCETTLIHRGGLAAPSADDQAAAYGTGPAGNEYPGGYYAGLNENSLPFWISTKHAIPAATTWADYLGYATWNGYSEQPRPELSAASPHAGTYGFFLPQATAGNVGLVGGVWCQAGVRQLGYSLIDPGDTLTFSCYFKTPNTVTGVQFDVSIWSATAYTILLNSQPYFGSPAPNVYALASETVVAPAGSGFVALRITPAEEVGEGTQDTYVDSIAVAIT